jgi:hypothetical protein
MISHKIGKKGWIQMYHLEGCGVDLLPRIHIGMSFSQPEFKFSWWSFHIEITIHRQLPDWFMFYVWDLLVNFNWNFGKKDEEE